MNNFDAFVCMLSPTQCKYTQQNYEETQNNAVHTTSQTKLQFPVREDNIKQTLSEKFGIAPENALKMEIIENSTNYSLYKSVLYLLSSKFRSAFTHEQKKQSIQEFIYFLIAQIDVNLQVKQKLRELKIRKPGLVEDIKNISFQPPNIIWLIAMIFDINIIILSQSTENTVEMHFSDEQHDTCKPYIILNKNEFNVYNAVCFDRAMILNFYDHEIIGQLIPTKYVSPK